MNTIRCAIYARYSSDLQKPASIEDQIRRCREFAARQRWAVMEEFIRLDTAKSGGSILNRDGLQSLVAAARMRPLPFNKLLIDDTSRLARDIPDAIRTIDILKYHGVHVCSVTQGIDTIDKSARQMAAFNAIIDETYSAALADKVHRGQEGRVRAGMISGGRCFGYENVPIEDPSRPAKYGRNAVSGVRLAIAPAQAAIVKRIFECMRQD
jgi:site-specific DNA recombinase